jgi:ribonucleotide monophosphatase NagD (HAD superfamily)
MMYYFDIDGVICSDEKGEYEKAKPFKKRIQKVNNLYDDGHTIVFYTGRGKKTKINWRKLTEEQFKKWGVKYHKILFTKEPFEILVDDKAINDKVFFNG